MITTSDLIGLFRYALEHNWGYILGTAGVLWTQARQDNMNKTTADKYDMARRYGKKWINHYVSDCSGLFAWSFKKLGSYMYHGSNTMYLKYCTSKGSLVKGKRSDGKELKPGTAVFIYNKDKNNYSHVGLYVGDGQVIEAASTIKGVIKSEVTNTKWTNWGELKNVNYGSEPTPEPTPTPKEHPTLRKGDKGTDVKEMQRKLLLHGETLPRYGVDGDFGNETLKALKNFQSCHTDENGNPLVVDGVCGKHTWWALDRGVD